MLARVPILAATVLFVIPLPARSQDSQISTPAQLHAYLSELSARDAFSGTVLANRDGRDLFSQAYGYAVREWQIANTSESVYKIGSITKQFTAAALLLLQERGQQEIDEPFCRYYSDCPESWKPITVRQLLNHTSGIPDIVRLPDFGSIVTLPTTLDATIARLKPLPLEAAPGTRF